ncbi:MAG: hypothetical protein U9N06_00225 [candidate division WOR-3 bacterium]|nr:hypothetical protein [candidate division WOR-3 bacterium]
MVILSVIFSIDKNRSSLAFIFFLLYPLSLFLATHLDKVKVVKALIIGGLVVSLFAVIQWGFGFYPHIKFEILGKIPVSISGTVVGLQKTNSLVRFLIMVFPLAIALFGSLKDFFWKFLVVSLLSLGILAMVPTKPLGGMITFILLLFMALFLKDWKIGLAFFVVILIPLLIKPDIPMELIERFTSYSNVKTRVDTWMRFAIPTVMKKAPLTGFGVGAYPVASRIFEGNFRYMHNHPHSFYIYSLSEIGILGFLSFFSLIFSSLILSFKMGKKDFLLLGAFFSIVGVLIEGLITSFLEYLPIGMVFWLILGLVASNFKEKELRGSLDSHIKKQQKGSL